MDGWISVLSDTTSPTSTLFFYFPADQNTQYLNVRMQHSPWPHNDICPRRVCSHQCTVVYIINNSDFINSTLLNHNKLWPGKAMSTQLLLLRAWNRRQADLLAYLRESSLMLCWPWGSGYLSLVHHVGIKVHSVCSVDMNGHELYKPVGQEGLCHNTQ